MAALLLAAAALLPARGPHTFDLRRPAANAGPLRLMATISGGEPLEWAGSALAGGDLNGDGLSDLVIGAPGGSDDRPSRRGRIYVLFGRVAFPPAIDLRVRRAVTVVPASAPVFSSEADLVIEGEDDFDHLGRAVAVADFDGDGFADIAAGAPRADGPGNSRFDCGEIVILHGAATLPAMFDLARPAPSIRLSRIAGAAQGEGLGSVLAAGDLTGDGRDDLIAGVPQARDAGMPAGPLDTGAVRVLEPGVIEGGALDLARPGGPGLVAALWGSRSGDLAGSAVAVGDFDGDARLDLAVGARGADAPEGRRPDAGAVYLLAGPLAQGSRGSLESRAAIVFTGGRVGDVAGSSLRFGDLDADGLEDLLIGADLADGAKGERLDAGEVQAVRGLAPEAIDALRALALPPGGRPGRSAVSGSVNAAQTGPVRIDLDRPLPAGGFAAHGADPGDHLGVRDAVDLDGDGRAEILLGAEDAASKRNSRAGGGEARLLFGASFQGAGSQVPAAFEVTVWGATGGTHLGRAIAAIDLDGDGRRELVISAPQAGQSLAGRVYILSGDWTALRRK